jgi:hypothetical protein
MDWGIMVKKELHSEDWVRSLCPGFPISNLVGVHARQPQPNNVNLP